MKLMDSIDRQPMRVSFGRRDGGAAAFAGSGGANSLPPPPGPIGLPNVDTRNAVQTTDIDPQVPYLRTAGFAAVGDGGHGLYVRAASEPAHAGKVQSADGAWWELQPDQGGYSVHQFGATGDGSTDDFSAVNDCVQTAIALSNTLGYGLDGAGGTAFAVTEVRFSEGGTYRLSQKITAANARIDLVGNRAKITGDDFNDFLFEFTGLCFRQQVRGLLFEATQAGCLKWDANNSSGSMVHIEDCRFATDRFGHESGIAIDYTGRSSQITIKTCLFSRIKHPAHFRNCDFMTFEDCWFGLPANAVYADRDAFIRVDKGFCRVNNCLFAGGPAANPVGTGATNGSEIAYFNVGIEGQAGPDEDHGRISITDTRIGFESGAGALVNYFVAHKGNTGAEFRSGIVLENIQTSPREEKVPNIEGDDTAYLLRLFEMPHQIVVNGVHCNQAILSLLTAGSTTTLPALRAQAETPIDHAGDFMDQLGNSCANKYSVENMTSVRLHLAATTDTFEHMRWLELFGRFNYIFPSDFPGKLSAGNTPVATIDTWFTDFSTQLGALFEVQGGADARIVSGSVVRMPVHGFVHVQFDEGADAIQAVYVDQTDTSGLPLGLNMQAGFTVGGTFSASVTQAQAPNATLTLQVRHANNPGTANIRCRGLMVRPVSALWPNHPGGGLVQGPS